MMKRVIWRANQVISIETRRRDENRKENVYVLAQMINRAQLLVLIYLIQIIIGKILI